MSGTKPRRSCLTVALWVIAASLPVVLASAPAAEAAIGPVVDVVALGKWHSCALTTDGGVKCWGVHGKLGDGTYTDSYVPVDVSGLSSGVVAIAAGSNHTCALTNGGGVKCWGSNDGGQLGNGVYGGGYVPEDVSGLSSGVVAIAAGGAHTCALTSDGGVKCWGTNWWGQLGDANYTLIRTPVDVSGLSSGVVAIAAGGAHTCALTSDGGVKCWGQNWWGQLGTSFSSSSYVPVDVSGLSSGVVAIAAGGYHTCALTSDGGVKCWGRNWWGQLGDGTDTASNVPVDVSGLSSGVVAIEAGGEHTCALTTDGDLKCWGNNDWGQLGDGTYSDSGVPVDVVWFGSSLTISASPTTLQPGETTTTLSGGLDMDGYGTLLGQTVHIARRNPDQTTTALSTATDSSGHYSVDDTPPMAGVYWYCARWIPDADHAPPRLACSPNLTVYRSSSSLTLTTSSRVVAYDSPVTVSVHLASPTYADTTNHTVDLLVTPAGSPTLDVPLTVDARGNASVTMKLKRNTAFTASYTGDVTTYLATATPKVKVGVKIEVSGTALYDDGLTGEYHLYHYDSSCPASPGRCPTVRIGTEPAQPHQDVRVELQMYAYGTWLTVRTWTTRLNSEGSVKARIPYAATAILGVPQRVRGILPGTQMFARSRGAWTYFEVVSDPSL